MPPTERSSSDADHDAPFIGRAADLERVEKLLLPTGALVTIVGAPGVGKTKLASEVLLRSACADRFTVLLADAASARDVLDAMVHATHAQLDPEGGDLLSQVGYGLAEMGEIVVLLDNAEQVIEPVAQALRVLRSAAPLARWVVTSRERLHEKGEWIAELHPLRTPAEGEAPRESEAVLLLVDRVERASGKPIDEAELPHVADIARRLEGIPLALELFSPRIALLGAATVADRLRLELEIHAEGPRSLDERQRTLYRAIETSWELLSERERDALARLSVFAGGFTVESAIAVLPDGGASGLDVLHRLRERSLIRTIDEKPLRFVVFQSVREFARELLPSTDGEAKAKLAEHLADEMDRAVAAPTAQARRSLLSEHENLRSVVGRARNTSNPAFREAAARILLGLELLIDRVPLEPYLDDITSFLQQAGDDLSPARRVGLNLAAARCKRRLGSNRQAIADLQGTLRMSEEAELPTWQARVTSELGMAYFVEGDFDSALSHWKRSTEIYLRAGDETRVALDELRSSMALREKGELILAMHTAERAYVRSRRLREAEMGALVLSELAHLRLELGEADRAATLVDEAERTPERSLLADAAIVARRGFIELANGNNELAKQRLQRALFLFHRVGYRRFEGGVIGYLGMLELEEGHLTRARTLLEQSVDLLRDYPVARGLFAAWLTVVESRAGSPERARLAALHVPHLVVSSPLSVASHILLRSIEPKSVIDDLALAFIRGARATAKDASQDVRLALRVLGRAASKSEAVEAAGLVVEADGAVFELDGQRISIAKHAAMRRILIRLVEEHLSGEVRSLTNDALAKAGWPGERILEDAAKIRVKVAIAGLRKYGLKDALIHDGAGYSLRRDLIVEVRASLPHRA